MALTYEQMIQIVAEFESQNPAISQNATVHGICLEVALSNSKAEGVLDAHAFEIRVMVSRPLSNATMQYVPQRHTSILAGIGATDWPIRVIETPPLGEEVRQGHAARQRGRGPGTVGHNFFVPGVGHCMMSNHHVLAQPNASSGEDIETRDPDATPSPSTHTADLQAWMNNETYDYALARFRNDTDCESVYRTCADGTTRGYVSEFATAVSLNERHFKVGLTTGCTTGDLLGVTGTVTVGGIERFGQLIFERMTQPGDSGSIVVHEKSNKIVGLHFAGFDHPTDPTQSRSYSNPIYLAGLRLVGHYVFLNGSQVPIYDAVNANVPVTPGASHALERVGLAKRGPGTALSTTEVADVAQERIGGQLFLGARAARLDRSGRATYSGPDPLPVSGGTITKVIVDGTAGGYHQGPNRPWVDGYAQVLFFG